MSAWFKSIKEKEEGMSEVRICLSSPPNREKLVAEIFFDNNEWAEINQDSGRLVVEFYPRRDGEFWRLTFDEALQALTKAKERLLKGSTKF